MKRYGQVLKLTTALLVIALMGPSVATLGCEIFCVAEHHAGAAPDAGGCHEHSSPASEAPAVGAVHACHDLFDAPLLVNPSGAPAVPLPVVVSDDQPHGDTTGAAFAVRRSIARLKPHALPPLATPLRI